jgi:hypothetical protein
MRRHLQSQCGEATNRCPICEGRFGLIRHYSWPTALCSKKCADRFKSRKEGDRRWLLPIYNARPAGAEIVISRYEEVA